MSDLFPRISLADVDDEPLETTLGGLAYSGLSTLLVAPTGSGKTLLGIRLLLDALRAGSTPVHMDMEVGARGTRRNYLAHGATAKELAAIHYVPMPEATMARAEEFVAAIADEGEDVVLLDKLPDFLRVAGQAENSNDEVSDWVGRFLDPLRDRATVLVIHATGWEGSRSRGASELAFKFDVVWEMKVLQEFDKQRIGRVRLRCAKDRWGDIGVGRTVEYRIGGDGAGRIVVERQGESFEAEAPDDAEGRAAGRVAAWAEMAVAAAKEHAPIEAAAKGMRQLKDLMPSGNDSDKSKGIHLAKDDGRLGFRPGPRGSVEVWWRADEPFAVKRSRSRSESVEPAEVPE